MPLNSHAVTPFTTGSSGELIYPMGSFSTVNDSNKQIWAVGAQTFDATQTSLLQNAMNANSKIVLENNCAYLFEVNLTGMADDGDVGAYKIVGGIVRITNAAGTALVGTQDKLAFEDDANWDAEVDVDTTLGALDILVTGVAAKQINWMAEVILWKVPGP